MYYPLTMYTIFSESMLRVWGYQERQDCRLSSTRCISVLITFVKELCTTEFWENVLWSDYPNKPFWFVRTDWFVFIYAMETLHFESCNAKKVKKTLGLELNLSVRTGNRPQITLKTSLFLWDCSCIIITGKITSVFLHLTRHQKNGNTRLRTCSVSAPLMCAG